MFVTPAPRVTRGAVGKSSSDVEDDVDDAEEEFGEEASPPVSSVVR